MSDEQEREPEAGELVNRVLAEAWEFGQNCLEWEKQATEAVLHTARALIDSTYLDKPAEELPEARRSHFTNAALKLQAAASLLLLCSGATGQVEVEPEEEADLAGIDVREVMTDRRTGEGRPRRIN